MGERFFGVQLPKRLPSTRSLKRLEWLPRRAFSAAGTVTTTFVLLALVALAVATPLPLTGTKKTRVLPLPGRKFLPRMVSFLPTFTLSGLTDFTTGALLAAAAVVGTSATSSSAESGSRPRRVIVPFVGRGPAGLEALFGGWTLAAARDHALAHVHGGPVRVEGGRRRGQAVAGAVPHETRGGALRHGGDRERGVHPERRGDRRGVDAEEPLVVERLAAVVHDAELLGVGHPAAAQRVGAVDAARLAQLHEARQAAPLHDLADRPVGQLADAERLLRQLVLERRDHHGPGVGPDRAALRRWRLEDAVVRVLDLGQQLDVVAPGRDVALLLATPPARLAGRPAAVVVEEVRQRRQEDLLEREARSVVAVGSASDPEVVGHRRDRLALVELAVAGQVEQAADLARVVLDGGDVVAVHAQVAADLARQRRQLRP